MFSVFTVALTGIIQSAGFAGSFEALFGTAYGRVLLAKVVLLVLLIGFGAFHQQVIAPRLEAWRMRDATGMRHAQDAARRFRASILAEAVVSVVLFAAVGVLTALPPAREVAAEAAAPVKLLSQTAGDLTFTLGITPAAVGTNQFDLRLSRASAGAEPVEGVEKAVLRFSDPAMDMGETEQVLEPYGGGHFVAQTFDLSMSGTWEIVAIVRRSGQPDARATFNLDLH